SPSGVGAAFTISLRVSCAANRPASVRTTIALIIFKNLSDKLLRHLKASGAEPTDIDLPAESHPSGSGSVWMWGRLPTCGGLATRPWAGAITNRAQVDNLPHIQTEALTQFCFGVSRFLMVSAPNPTRNTATSPG